MSIRNGRNTNKDHRFDEAKTRPRDDWDDVAVFYGLLSQMNVARQLIVNADDFGISAEVNRGIREAYENGIVTSASLMVRWPGAKEAAAYGQANPQLSLGLHVDLGEWFCEGGDWQPRYETVPLTDASALEKEVARQLDAFWELVGRAPTHVDSHQHVHLDEPLRSLLMEACSRLGVPLRRCDPRIQYCGDFYGQRADGSPLGEAIGVEALCAIIGSLALGTTELCCHPGYASDLETTYQRERAQEVRTLCDPRVKTEIAARGIRLCSFAEAFRAGDTDGGVSAFSRDDAVQGRSS